MEELAEDVRVFLVQHPQLELVPGNKVRFTLSGHEMPCRLLDLQKFTAGKKYKKMLEMSFDRSKYEPHIVPSTKNNGGDDDDERNDDDERKNNGSLGGGDDDGDDDDDEDEHNNNDEECQKLGVEFVPACLKNKGKQRKLGGEPSSGKKEQLWEPEDSGGEDSDSGDSMSDLYPAHMFTKNTKDAGENGDFQSDNGEEMEVEESVNSHGKRPQKQMGPSSKRLKSRHKKSKNVKKSAK
ncbi:surfeit locus protein 2 [Mantella aurantiaca]